MIVIGLLLMYLPLVSNIPAYIPYVLFQCTGDMFYYDTRLSHPLPYTAGCKMLPSLSEKLVAVMNTSGFLIIPPIGLGILAYCFFKRHLSKTGKIFLILGSCPVVVLILAHFMPPMVIFVLLGAGLIALVTPYLAVFFNFGLSFFSVKYLKVNRPLKISIFIAVSILMTLNVRIPGIASDLFYAATKGERIRIDRQVVLPRTEPVSLIQNIETIEYRRNPLGTYTLIADFESLGPHVGRPAISKVRIEEHLLSKGFLVDRNGKAKTKLIVDSQDNGYTVDLNLSVFNGEEETARYQNRLRKSYILENHGDLARYRETNSMSDQLLRFILAAFQDSAWNKMAFALLEDKDRDNRKPLLEFVDLAINIDQQPLPVMKISVSKAAIAEKVEDALPVKLIYEKYMDYYRGTLVSGCGGETTGTKVVMPFPDDHYLLFISDKRERKVYFKRPIVMDNPSASLPAYRPKKVICEGNEVIVILVPLSKTNVIAVRYSLSGDCLGVYQIKMPTLERSRGMSRTEVVDFKKLRNSYEFTILDIPEESLKRLAHSDYFYQFTPSDIKNGVAEAYRISFER